MIQFNNPETGENEETTDKGVSKKSSLFPKFWVFAMEVE